MSDSSLPQQSGSWRTSLVVGLQIIGPSLLLAGLTWLGASAVTDRFVAGSLTIAVLAGANSFFQGVFAHRLSWRIAVWPALVIIPLFWWLGWLLMTYNVRHP